MTPGLALAASPGCEAVNFGALDGSVDGAVFAELWTSQRFVTGDIVSISYVQNAPGTLKASTPGGLVETGSASSGTLTVTFPARDTQLVLSSEDGGAFDVDASCTAGPDVPVSKNSTATVGEDSGSQWVFLEYENLLASPTGARIVSGPQHGTATVEDASTLAYTPDPGYLGTDTIQFVGFNADGDSNVSTVTITVEPELGMNPRDGSTLPTATIGQPYSFTFTPRNCVGTCTFSLSDRTFGDDLSIDENTGMLSGTITTFNPYGGDVHELEIYVYDDNDGLSADYDFFLPVVEAAAPTAGPSTTTINANPNWVPPLDLVYSGGVRSVAITVPPRNGTTRKEDGKIFYTPNLNFMGTDQLSFTVSNNFGTSQPAVATIIVGRAQQGQLFPASGPLPNGFAGKPYSQQIELVDQVATYSYTGTLPAGLTLDPDTGLLSGVIDAGELNKNFSFDVTSLDEWGYTQTASYTLSVVEAAALGMLPADMSVLPTATVGQPYSVAFTGLNCVGTCRFSLSDDSFAQGEMTIDAVTGTLSGTPSSFNVHNGTATHELRVSLSDDENQDGTVDNTVSHTFTMPIDDVAPVARPSTTTISANPGHEQSLLLDYTAGAPAITITVQPQNGTARVNGAQICYMPNPNFRGTDTLTYTVSNGFGTSQPAVATIIVDRALSAQLLPASGPLPEGMAGEPYSQQIELVGQAATYSYIGDLPPGLTLDAATGLLSGRIALEALGQTFTFSVTALDEWEYARVAAYTLSVVQAEVRATNKEVEVPQGSAPLPVDLTAGASGGPFSDAALISLEPANAGTIKLTSGDVASTDYSWVPGNFYLKFIPNPEFSGTAVVRYVLRSNMGISDPATVTFRAPLAVKAIGAHVDGLVRGFVNERQNLIAAQVDHPGLLDRRRMAAGQQPGTVEVSPTNNSVALNFSSSLAEMQSWQALDGQAGAEASDPFNAWVEGRFVLHLRNDGTLEHKGDFGLFSVGADYLVNEQFLVGVALHADSMRDFATATTTQGKGVLAGPYMSVELVDNVYFDASLLYGKSWNEVSTAFFSGTFETDRVLGKARLTGNWQIDEALSLRPDATMVLSTERAGDYTVRNAQGDEVTVSGFTSTQLRVSAGALLEYRMALDNGLVLTPQLGASLGLSSSGQSINPSRAFGTLTLGLQLLSDGGWNFGTALDFGIDGAGAKSAAIKARLAAGF